MSAAEINRFIRHTPRSILEPYVKTHAPHLFESFVWPSNENDHIPLLLAAVDKMDRDEREILRINAERVNEMSDEEGQAALLSVVQDFETFENLENAHHRATWVFINDNAAFRHAEETRYADHNRQGRMWDGFIGPQGIKISSDPLALETFRTRLTDIFGKNTKMKIEVYSRQRPDDEDGTTPVEQIVVYREGLPDSYPAFEGNDLVTKIIRPVYEVVICYEPATGVIEIVAKDKEQREAIACMFSETMLGTAIEGNRLPLRQYDLSSLATARSFQTEPEDGIEDVKVLMIKLRPLEGGGSVTLEISNKHPRSIYEQSREWFEDKDPLQNGFAVHQAKLSVRFYPTASDKRGKVLPLKITMPNRCDLKSRTEHERLIGEKYLERWKLLKQIECLS